MHNHNLFVVQAEDKKTALAQVRAYLDKAIEEDDHHGADYYQIGGRFMWSNLVEKNMDRIAPKGFYIDGGIQLDYALKRQVDADPEETEVIDATDPKFHERVNEMRQARYEEIGRSLVYAHKPETNQHMKDYYKKEASTILKAKTWNPELYLWNLTDSTADVDFKTTDKDPSHWFLVNVDVHH